VEDILSKVGEDLAILVYTQGLPTIDLNVKTPKVKGFKLLDVILMYLPRVMNSMFFVGDNFIFLDSYINSLALVMNDHNKYANLIHALSSDISTKNDIEVEKEVLKQRIERLIGKRLHTLSVEKLLSLTGYNPVLWDEVLGQLTYEAQTKGYLFVIKGVSNLFKQENRGLLDYQCRYLFYITRAKAKLTFIAPLLWDDYVNDIENGMFPLIIKHWTPILFTPRPSDLPSYPIIDLSPDSKFDFRT